MAAEQNKMSEIEFAAAFIKDLDARVSDTFWKHFKHRDNMNYVIATWDLEGLAIGQPSVQKITLSPSPGSRLVLFYLFNVLLHKVRRDNEVITGEMKIADILEPTTADDDFTKTLLTMVDMACDESKYDNYSSITGVDGDTIEKMFSKMKFKEDDKHADAAMNLFIIFTTSMTRRLHIQVQHKLHRDVKIDVDTLSIIFGNMYIDIVGIRWRTVLKNIDVCRKPIQTAATKWQNDNKK